MIKQILNIVPTISQEADGVANFVTDYSYSMRALHVNVEVAALKWNDSNIMVQDARLFDISLGLYKLGLSFPMKKWIKKINNKSEFQLIHSHGLWMMPGIIVAKPRHRRSYLLMISPHGSLSKEALSTGSIFKKPFWFLFQKRALKRCDCFHATSAAEVVDIQNLNLGRPICLIPPGVKIPRLPKRINRSRKTLLYLARIHPIKGLGILLEAWKKIEEDFKDWDLVIAGTDCDGYLFEMQSLALQLKLNNINFLGPVYGQEKEKLYTDSDLYILPTYSENFGITIAEALSFGTPVITTRNTPWSDLVSKGAGWYIDATVDSIVVCLQEALPVDNKKLIEMGISGRKWMIEDFSWKKTSEKFLTTYDWLHGSGNAPTWIIK